MEYKQLQPSDVQVSRELIALFERVFGEEYISDNHVDDMHLQRYLENRNTITLVAKDGDQVVGGLVAYLLEKLGSTTPEIYLYDLAVDESYRRKGIATALISTLQEIGRQRGAKVMFVQADNVDAPAVALYTKLAANIEKEVTHFDIGV